MANTQSSTVARSKMAKRNEDLVIAENSLEMERIVARVRLATILFISLSFGFGHRVLHVPQPKLDSLQLAVTGLYALFTVVTIFGLNRAKPNVIAARKAQFFVAVVDFGFVTTVALRMWSMNHRGSPAQGAAICALLMCFSLGRVSRAAIVFSWALACSCYTLVAWYIGTWSPGEDLFILACFTALALLLIKMQSRTRKMFLDLRRRDNLTRFLPPQVAEEVMTYGDNQLQPVQREVTVLFSDIRDFTTFSESLPPGAVLSFLDEYFAHMGQLVKAHEGIVNKFIGDGMLAFWGVPKRNEHHAELAVKAALDMRKVVEELNQVRRNNGAQPIRIGIGVHTGPVAAGMLGGSDQHEYTVIGDAVNVASRVEGLTKNLGVDILVSQSTWELLGGQFSGERLEEQKVKGRKEAVVVYALREKLAKADVA